MDAQTRQDYVAEAVALTGLDNPNSVAQLSRWLQEETGEEVADLRKDTVADLLGKELPGDKARRVLEIRRELGKTSNKKYTALANAVCADSRVRGLLQFYGANRTGRWAGRIVQPQNLPPHLHRRRTAPPGPGSGEAPGCCRAAGGVRLRAGHPVPTHPHGLRCRPGAHPGGRRLLGH